MLDDTLARHLPPLADRGFSTGHLAATQMPAQAGPAPIDAKVLEALVGSDPALLDEFLHDFRQGAVEALQHVHDAARHQEAGRISAVAHRLKSSAAAVGARTLHDLCEQLEVACEANDWAAVTTELRAFEREIKRVEAHLETM